MGKRSSRERLIAFYLTKDLVFQGWLGQVSAREERPLFPLPAPKGIGVVEPVVMVVRSKRTVTIVPTATCSVKYTYK